MFSKFLITLRQKPSLLSFLSEDERKTGIGVLIISILAAILESFGVFSVLPFFTAVSDPKSLETNENLNLIYLFLNNYGVT